MIAHIEDCINPTFDGNLSWRSISSCTLDSDEGLENWKHRLHELSVRGCVRITKSLHWIGSEVCELPHFEGLSDAETFFVKLEIVVVK